MVGDVCESNIMILVKNLLLFVVVFGDVCGCSWFEVFWGW